MKRQPLDAVLAELDQQHLTRRRTTIDGFVEPGNRTVTASDGRVLVDFSGNDYLGLAHHPAIAAAMSVCAQRYGAGSGASHLVTGHGIEHERLEEDLAAYTGRERALLFSTGYMANLGVMTALAGRGESVLLDRLSHASLIDGALLSGARFKRYAHADAAAAERLLDEDAAVVATDGVFSMDGDVAPLEDLARVSKARAAWLVVDDAHGLGVLGKTGRGSTEHLSANEVPVLVGTLGKAFGSFGAFVAGSRDLVELLIQKARPYIYTTALPQPVAAATRKALAIAQEEPWRREHVLALTARFRAAAGAAGLPLLESTTPIQPVILGSSAAALQAQRELLDAGLRVVAIRAPTVPRGSERLRVTLSASHTEKQVDALVERLSEAHSRFAKGHEA
ncbi:MAG TPA: 8-amino-7-oxononanoate synthase [Steroidobacteraceae bacterium]|nr:8-amino-7-oxononanoate synthase [Steroidobacteraceae bacterium]